MNLSCPQLHCHAEFCHLSPVVWAYAGLSREICGYTSLILTTKNTPVPYMRSRANPETLFNLYIF